MKKDIYLPHIHYTVKIREFKSPPKEISNAQAYTEHDKNGQCTVYLPKGKQEAGDVAHELIHILQFMCLDRNMRFELEQEHMGYMMHYLMGCVFNSRFETTR